MAPRAYEEVVRFAARSPESLDYWQRSTDAADGSMNHSEAGIWRVTASDVIEVSVALPGATEVSEGTFDADLLALASTAVSLASSGARLLGTRRRYEIQADAITYDFEIATAAFAMSGNVRGELHRAGEEA